MPKCVVCEKFMPSAFMEDTSDKKAHKCQFCIREKDKIEYVKDGKQEIVTKDWVIAEYQKYINSLVRDNKKIRKIVMGDDDQPTH